MFQYCPVCASKKIKSILNRVNCMVCGFDYFQNTAAATGAIIVNNGKVLFQVRNKDPAKGKLGLPGGFVDPGESALVGLQRELQEELGWQPHIPPGASLTDVFTFFASFPNTYLFKNITYNTCDLFFIVTAPHLKINDLKLDKNESSDAFFACPKEINPADLAFDSTRLALEAYLESEKSRNKI